MRHKSRPAALALTMAFVGSLLTLYNPAVVAAAMPACAGTTVSRFLGNGRGGSGLKGVYGEIEKQNKLLCTQGATVIQSWSLSWVSIDGPQSATVPGIDIFQGGYAQCPPPAVGSCPWNNGVLYYWVYYAREQGPCGSAFNTGIIDLGNAPTGYHFFQASKVGTNYNFYVDEVLKHSRFAWEIDDCWPGITQVEWQHEMLNVNDQGGGHVANRQNFQRNQYQNATGWHDANRPLNTNCDANSFPAHWTCLTTTSARGFEAWDDRVP